MAEPAQPHKVFDPALVPLTRREFLNYAWLASLGFVFLVGCGGAAYLFAMPRVTPGEFGGLVALGKAGDILPKPNDPPLHVHAGKFWLVNVNGMIVALSDRCTHLDCLYDWNAATGRFECPCHGSKFTREGKRIAGPAARQLDRMPLLFRTDGQPVAASDAHAHPLAPPADPNAEIVVETGKIVRGE